jgi:hypothetical protein
MTGKDHDLQKRLSEFEAGSVIAEFEQIPSVPSDNALSQIIIGW